MRILRAADHRRMPWKNNKGMTTQIAVFPQGAGLDDFAWRISTAGVVEDGAFSIFPGIDRTLSVLRGEGIELHVAKEEPAILVNDSAPFAFPADAQTHATLLSGPITDLNVMTRRGAFRHSVQRITLEGESALDCDAETTLLLCHTGSLKLTVGADQVELSPLDAVLLPQGTHIDIDGRPAASFFTIALDPFA